MPDGRPPELPATAPVELVEFIECKRDSVTITGGDLTWLPIDPSIAEFAPTPTLSLEPGASPGTGTMTIGLGFASLTLPVSVVGGELQIDTSGVSIPGAKQAIDTWVKDLNDWFRRNGKRFKQTSIKAGSVTLEKEPIPVAPPAGGGGTVGGGGTPPTPVPPTPVTPVTPATPPSNSGCWFLGLIALVIVAVIGAALVTGILVLPGGGGGAVASTSPAASVAAVPSGPQVSSAPPAAPSSAPPSTAPPPSSAPPAVEPPPAGAESALAFLEQYAGLTAGAPAGISWQTDETGDWYFPQPGVTTTQEPPETDLTAATGFLLTLTTETAQAITDAGACAVESALADGTKFRTACNQDKPLAPGEYVVIVTTHASGFPPEFPAAGLHSWSVFTNPDDDPATGYASSLEDNFLTGADTYQELLAFESAGAFKYYILATRMADPVRSDTGQKQGNLATTARVVWFYDEGTQTWFIPKEHFGPNWYAGGFATTNRGANSPDTLAADALRSPKAQEWLEYLALDPLRD